MHVFFHAPDPADKLAGGDNLADNFADNLADNFADSPDLADNLKTGAYMKRSPNNST